MERGKTVKEIQERKIVSSLEGINKSLGRIAAYLQKIAEKKTDQPTTLTVLGQLEETGEDIDNADITN